jgi:peptidoglycan/xylan/chitin deacetylase (PgdA/CDA1 family)
MSVLVVNYHRTVTDVSDGGLHTLVEADFDRHLRVIRDTGVSVVAAQKLEDQDQGHSSHQIAITFDDGFKSDLANAAKLADLGWTATFFVSTANIGKADYLSVSEIKELEKMGMIVGSHSHEHVRLTTIPPDAVDREVARSKDILEQIVGHPVEKFAFPGGAYNQNIVYKLRSAGFRFAFGTEWGLNDQLPQLEAGIVRRNSAVRGMSDAEISDLVTLTGYRRRQMKYFLRSTAFKVLPENVYAWIRKSYLRANI